MSTEPVELQAGGWRLHAVPFNGGGILDFVAPSGAVIMAGPGGPYGRPQGLACFPMTPFVGRLPDRAVVGADGQIHRIVPNLPSGEVAHGIGWLRPWTVERQTEALLVVSMRHQEAAGSWPWRFSSRQQIRLGSGSVSITLSTRNLDAVPMPCSSGLHPYLETSDDDRLMAGGELVQPLERGAGQTLKSRNLQISSADRSVNVRSSFERWHMFQPPDRRAICMEPLIGQLDTTPDIWLQPGQTQQITLTIDA